MLSAKDIDNPDTDKPFALLETSLGSDRIVKPIWMWRLSNSLPLMVTI